MCPITCENRYLPPAPCIASCKEGCECENGYMRHENGTCVPESQCCEYNNKKIFLSISGRLCFIILFFFLSEARMSRKCPL